MFQLLSHFESVPLSFSQFQSGFGRMAKLMTAAASCGFAGGGSPGEVSGELFPDAAPPPQDVRMAVTVRRAVSMHDGLRPLPTG